MNHPPTETPAQKERPGSELPVPGSGTKQITATSGPEPTTHNPEPSLDHRVALLHQYFFNRQDFVAVKSQKGHPFPVAPQQGNLKALLEAHVLGRRVPQVKAQRLTRNSAKLIEGHFRVGSYAPALDGTTRWLCIDFDGAGHSHPLKSPTDAALDTLDNFKKKKLPAYLEKSGGGHGWHIWCFFSEPVCAASVRKLGLAMAPRNARLLSGGMAQPEKSVGIEVFPKQNKPPANGYGNMVYLPWWHGAPAGASQFYAYDHRHGLLHADPHVPEAFETIVPEDLYWVVLAYEEPRPDVRFPAASREWGQWREMALEALDLGSVYGNLLTGVKNGENWLQCRDPLSPTGDRDPSASVATGGGKAEKGAFHSFIRAQTCSVFDFLVQTGKASSFKEALRLVAELSGVRLPVGDSQLPAPTTPTIPTNGTPSSQDTGGDGTRCARSLSSIQVNNRQFRDIIEDAWNTLTVVNQPPRYFRREGEIVRVAHDLAGPKIERMGENAILGMLGRIADWVTVNGPEASNTNPPVLVARDMLAYIDPRLPRLQTVTTVPVFGKSGELLDQPGYHAGDRNWFEPGESLKNLPAVSREPTPQEIESAKALILDDLLVDFPFVDDSDRCHYLALLCLPFMRRMITSCTPLHLIEAPTMGSGKGLLCGIVSMLLTGTEGVVGAYPQNEDERQKRLTSQLSSGKPLILLDNASEKRELDSPVLASILTSFYWSDRVLGHNKMITLTNQAVWIMTGNNPRMTMELARRCVRVRIDPKRDKPWRRKGFRHPALLEWVGENRPQLLHAILTLIQAWVAAGKPHGNVRLGSFEDWAACMGGMMEVIGVPGFLGNLDSLYEEADLEGRAWRAFIQAWWEAFGTTPMRVRELNEFCNKGDFLNAVRGDKSPRSQETRLGYALARNRDRVFGEVMLVRAPSEGSQRGGQVYALKAVTPDPEPRTITTAAPSTPTVQTAATQAAAGQKAFDLCDLDGMDDLDDPEENGGPEGGPTPGQTARIPVLEGAASAALEGCIP